MDDPATRSWFLPFDAHNSTPYHVPQCDKNYSPPRCTSLYHDQEQTPGFPKGDGDCPGPCDCGVHPCGECVRLHVARGLFGALAPAPLDASSTALCYPGISLTTRTPPKMASLISSSTRWCWAPTAWAMQICPVFILMSELAAARLRVCLSRPSDALFPPDPPSIVP